MRDLTHRRRGAVDGSGDLVVVEIEHLAQHEYGPLHGRQRIQVS
jgi:hypothetical protein